MQKMKSTFWKAKANEKSEKMRSFVAGAGLRLRPKSACATRVGLDATVSVDLCHRSGLKYLSHGFQTQGIVAAKAGLRLRPKSACATGVGLDATVRVDLCRRSGLKYLSHGFQTQDTVAAEAGLKVRSESTCVPGHGFQTQGTEREYLGYLDPCYRA
jgi:hypothetical protein